MNLLRIVFLAALCLALPAASAQAIHMSAQSAAFTDPAGTAWTPNLCTGTLQFPNPGTYVSPLYNMTAYTASPMTAPIACQFNVPPGVYSLVFHLIEPVKSFNAPRKRVFNILANGSPVMTGIDIFQRGGGVEVPYDLNGTAASNGSGIYVLFVAIESSAIFSGIEVIPLVRYADQEVPARGGAGLYSLANAPAPGSLQFTVNGLVQHEWADYRLTGKALAFLPGAYVPEPGDLVLAWYRY